MRSPDQDQCGLLARYDCATRAKALLVLLAMAPLLPIVFVVQLLLVPFAALAERYRCPGLGRDTWHES